MSAPARVEVSPVGCVVARHHLDRRLSLVVLMAMLVGMVWLVRTTAVFPVRVGSASMEPTLGADAVVLVSRSAPAASELNRGDLVTFRRPETGELTLKRVIGLPGEELVILDGVLRVDGEPVRETYVDPDTVDGYYSRTFQVPAHSVFVLGDNRGNSVDSRDYGPVPDDRLLGRVLATIWPLG